MPGKKNLRMKAARAAAGLSQADLAQAVGVTRQTIGLIEAGGYNPTLNLCVAICKALRVTLNDLFWEDEKDADPNANMPVQRMNAWRLRTRRSTSSVLGCFRLAC